MRIPAKHGRTPLESHWAFRVIPRISCVDLIESSKMDTKYGPWKKGHVTQLKWFIASLWLFRNISRFYLLISGVCVLGWFRPSKRLFFSDLIQPKSPNKFDSSWFFCAAVGSLGRKRKAIAEIEAGIRLPGSEDSAGNSRKSWKGGTRSHPIPSMGLVYLPTFGWFLG